jgi:hypothetical protein
VDRWIVFRPSLETGRPEIIIRDASGNLTVESAASAPAHNYTFGVDFQGSDLWVATAKGLSHGIRIE